MPRMPRAGLSRAVARAAALPVASAADCGPRTQCRDALARTFSGVTASETSAGRHATDQLAAFEIRTGVTGIRERGSRLENEIIAAWAAAGFEPRVAQRTTRMTTRIS